MSCISEHGIDCSKGHELQWLVKLGGCESPKCSCVSLLICGLKLKLAMELKCFDRVLGGTVERVVAHFWLHIWPMAQIAIWTLAQVT